MIWNEHFETMDRERMRAVQSERLRETVKRLYYNVPFYRKKFQEAGVEPSDVRGVEDLPNLPFTTKQDLRDNYPFGMFAAPRSEVVRVHASSGTTGQATVVGYTRRDIELWSEVVARTLRCAGISREDVLQIAYGYGLFTGGLGVHYGAERVGATVVPVSGGATKRQVQLMRDFGSTAIGCTPSYALFLAEAIRDEGIAPDDLKLRVGVFGAEPWTEEMRREIESKLRVKAIDIYGLSEIIGPGVSSECEAQDGLHIFEDHFIPEIVDPETLEPLPEGETGEIVFTTVTKEALPLLRYRTRDLTSLTYEKCRCGRTAVRMRKCVGRSDDMMIVRGVNVFPSQIESVLLETAETEPHYLIVLDRKDNLDTLEVHVEVNEQFFSDEIRRLEELTRSITQKITAAIGVGAKVKLVEPNSVARSEGKAKRVIDNRNLT
jgi:phenylacetate-CoA ligase